MRALACLVCLGACADGGLIIDVDPGDPQIDRVRIYISTSDATSDQGLIEPDGAFDPVTYWPRDPGNETDVVDVGPDELATFELVHTRADKLTALIAVGYAGGVPIATGSLFDQVIPHDHLARYGISLRAPVTAPAMPSPLQLSTWSPDSQVPASEAVCVGLFDAEAAYPSAFIVNHDDPDCDGLETGAFEECEPNIYFGARIPGPLTDLTCLAKELEPSALIRRCSLGAPGCIDGRGPDPMGCEPSTYCTPTDLCQQCETIDCAGDVTKLTSPPSVVRCTVPTDLNGEVCTKPLLVPPLPTNGRACTAIAIRDGTTAFTDRIEKGNVKIRARLDPTCAISFDPEGSIPTASGGFDMGGLVALDLAGGRGLAIPFVFSVAHAPGGACTNQSVTCDSSEIVEGSVGACFGSWGTPMLVPAFASAELNDDPTLPADMLEIYFNRADTLIMKSTRASVTSPWTTPTIVTELSGSGPITSTPEISADGLTMYLNSTRPGGPGGADIFISTRPDRAAATAWSAPVRITSLLTLYQDYGAATDGVQLHMAFNSNRTPGVGYDLFEAVRGTATDPWSVKGALAALNSPRDELSPFLTLDGLTIYFHSNRITTLNHELFTSHRATFQSPFDPPTRITELSTAGVDGDPWVSPDGRTMFFASDRGGPTAIYEVDR